MMVVAAAANSVVFGCTNRGYGGKYVYRSLSRSLSLGCYGFEFGSDEGEL